jgi:PAS domain S-box-containing protein
MGKYLQLRDTVLGYGFALAMAIACILLRFALTPLLGSMTYQYVTIFPGIVIVAILAGKGAALFAAIVASLLAEHFFSPGLEISDIPSISFVIFTGLLAGWLSDRLHKALAQSRQTSAALAESEQRLKATFDNARVGILEVEAGDRVVRANNIACRILGRSLEQLLSMDVHELTWPEDRELSDRLNRELRGGLRDHLDYEKRYIRGDGSPVWVHVTVSGLRDSQGQWFRSVATIEDITERKHYLDQLEKVKAQLENRSKELETIISIVSHDLRAPLVNVRGFAKEIDKDIKILRELIEKESSGQDILKKIQPISDDFLQSTNFIASSAEAMDNLAASLVNITRAGLGTITPEELDMNEILAKVVASIQFKFRENDVEYDIASNLPLCLGDRQQITQIFTNLLDNAVKYLDPNRPGLICVDGGTEHGKARYIVADNGIGMEPSQEYRIFEPYYQLHEKPVGGAGLGLATVKRMIDRNGGQIWVCSEKGKGTTFYIALPIAPTDKQ